jgi:hypothetical protein
MRLVAGVQIRSFRGGLRNKILVFLGIFSGARAGGYLVPEANFRLRRDKVRWDRFVFLFGLASALAFLSSCGSSSTAVTPSITASCVATQGTGADVTVLGTAQCTASVLNASSTLVNWSVSGTGNGSIDTTSGLYTAPAAVPTNNVVTITATSQSQASLSTTTSVTIEAATAITAIVCNDPSGNQASTVSSGNKLSCTAYASVSTGTTVPVNWTIANATNPNSTASIGSISAQGIYTAPQVPPPGQKVTITATSQALATETMSVPVSVVFGNAVLSGSFAFSTAGRLTSSSNAFWARVGIFTLGGGALSGLEDTNQGGTPNIVKTQRSFTGSYSIGIDGRGTMQFCEDTSSPCPPGSPSVTAYFNIVVISPNQAQIIETPPTGTLTASGEMISQDPSVFGAGNANLSGAYSFNFSGVSNTATEESVVGDFAANGFGNINAGSVGPPPASGRMDLEAGGVAPSEVAILATTYSVLSNGRGTVKLNGLNFSFYPVSASRAKFIEIDPVPPSTTTSSILSGDAYKQQTSLACGWNLNALNGSAVFETSGMVTSGASSGFVIGDIGSFTASNNGATGTVSAASIDENSGGTVSSQVGTLSGSYTMDPCGRGTLAIGAHTYVFYVITTSDAVLQETTAANAVVANGFLVPSPGGPFANSSLTGSYGFAFTGTNTAGATGQREDFLGQLTSTGSGTGLAGTADLNNFGVTQTGVAITNGTYLPAGSLRATMSLPLSTTPSASTRNLVLYMVSPTLFYALDTDPSPAGTAIGTIYNQF